MVPPRTSLTAMPWESVLKDELGKMPQSCGPPGVSWTAPPHSRQRSAVNLGLRFRIRL